MRTARARIDDPVHRAPLSVDYYLTRDEWATLLYYSPQWRPGCSARVGQWHAANLLRADPAAPERPAPKDSPRFRAALRDVERWLLFPTTPREAEAR